MPFGLIETRILIQTGGNQTRVRGAKRNLWDEENRVR